MQRPTRIAAVLATTGLLMTATAVGAISLQSAVAGGDAPAIVAEAAPSADTSASVVDPVAILGDPASGATLPSIADVLSPPASAQVPSAGTARSDEAPNSGAAAERPSAEREGDDDEREGDDD